VPDFPFFFVSGPFWRPQKGIIFLFLDHYNGSPPTFVKKRFSTAHTPTPHPHDRFNGAYSARLRELPGHFSNKLVCFGYKHHFRPPNQATTK